MPTIKRYPNRKLYDTTAKRYITLEGIAWLIRQGEKVTVVDHATGEDLTTVTLTQIILEQERKRNDFLPQSVLTGLIQAGGETMSSLRRALSAPLNLARHVDEEIEERVQALISRGELAAEEGHWLRERLLAPIQRPADEGWPSEVELERALSKRGIPTQEDLQRIKSQLQVLAAKLENASPEPE